VIEIESTAEMAAKPYATMREKLEIVRGRLSCEPFVATVLHNAAWTGGCIMATLQRTGPRSLNAPSRWSADRCRVPLRAVA
jgi:hypothetical protein